MARMVKSERPEAEGGKQRQTMCPYDSFKKTNEQMKMT